MTSKLTEIRTSRGISQRKLEQLTGIHQQTISRFEKGMPISKIQTAEKLAKALKCEVSDLLESNVSFDVLADKPIKNINNYIKATRELLDISPRQAANILDMEEKEYLDCENPNNPTPLDDALLICALLFADYSRLKLSTALHTNSQSEDVSDCEAKVLEEFRSLTAENKDRFLNLIKATPLIK